jgi:hypothetical protein
VQAAIFSVRPGASPFGAACLGVFKSQAGSGSAYSLARSAFGRASPQRQARRSARACDSLCNVFRKIVDAIEVVGDVQGPDDLPQVDRHGLPPGDRNNCLFFDAPLQRINPLISVMTCLASAILRFPSVLPTMTRRILPSHSLQIATLAAIAVQPPPTSC